MVIKALKVSWHRKVVTFFSKRNPQFSHDDSSKYSHKIFIWNWKRFPPPLRNLLSSLKCLHQNNVKLHGEHRNQPTCCLHWARRISFVINFNRWLRKIIVIGLHKYRLLRTGEWWWMDEGISLFESVDLFIAALSLKDFSGICFAAHSFTRKSVNERRANVWQQRLSSALRFPMNSRLLHWWIFCLFLNDKLSVRLTVRLRKTFRFKFGRKLKAISQNV